MPENCSCCTCKTESPEPLKLTFRIRDYLNALYCWVRSYRNSVSMKPGLYFTGTFRKDSPVIVTCNYFLTLFILWRYLRSTDTRILVIDTGGINVWCAAGKGTFSAENIMNQLNKHDKDLVSTNGELILILPKLSLSGVSLADLRRNGIRPVIGPVYGSELVPFIPSADCADDLYAFDLKDRLFTLVPTLSQIIMYSLYIFLPLLVLHHFFNTGFYWHIFPVTVLITICYIVLFPFLPSKMFALKGLFLFIPQFILLLFLFFKGGELSIGFMDFMFYSIFLSATNILFGLYYTGNTGVSSYTFVKREIIHFLPLVFFLYLAAAVILTVKVVLS